MDNLTVENEEFVSQVVAGLLKIPNLQETINPLLTDELKEKFEKAGERFKEIISSFNSLPGVRAELYEFDSNPDALMEITIPATSLFLRNKDAFVDRCRLNETLCITAGFQKAKITHTDLGERDKPASASEICEEWQKNVFGKVSNPGEILNCHGAEKAMTIPELYVAVQTLIASYLKALDK